MSKWTETAKDFNSFWSLHRLIWNLEALTQMVKICLKDGSEVEGFIQGGETATNVGTGLPLKANGNIHVQTTSGRMIEIDLTDIDEFMRRL